MRELGAFYESQQREIHSYLRRHANCLAPVKDIMNYTGLSETELEMIVDHDLDLTREYSGDYIKSHA